MTGSERDGGIYPPNYIRRIFAMGIYLFSQTGINYSHEGRSLAHAVHFIFSRESRSHPKRKNTYRDIRISEAFPSRAF